MNEYDRIAARMQSIVKFCPIGGEELVKDESLVDRHFGDHSRIFASSVCPNGHVFFAGSSHDNPFCVEFSVNEKQYYI